MPKLDPLLKRECATPGCCRVGMWDLQNNGRRMCSSCMQKESKKRHAPERTDKESRE